MHLRATPTHTHAEDTCVLKARKALSTLGALPHADHTHNLTESTACDVALS